MPKSLSWCLALSVLHCFPRISWIGRQHHKEKMKSHQYGQTRVQSEMFQKGSLVFTNKKSRSHGDSLDMKARLNEDHLSWVSKKFTINTSGRDGDEVLKPVVEVRLTTDSGVPRRLPSRHCRLKCLLAASTAPLLNIVTRLLSMYICFCNCEDVAIVELKTLSDWTLSLLKIGSETNDLLLIRSHPYWIYSRKWISVSERTNYINFSALEVK